MEEEAVMVEDRPAAAQVVVVVAEVAVEGEIEISTFKLPRLVQAPLVKAEGVF
jgi:hypothetical protein